MNSILHVTSSMNPKYGGVAEAIRNIEVGIISLGKATIGERHVVSLDDPNEVNNWDNKGLKVVGLAGTKKIWTYNPNLYPWLEKEIANYEIIIIHGLWQYHTHAVAKLLNSRKKAKLYCPKVYLMPHGMLDPWFQKEKSRKLKAIRNDIYWKFIENNVVNSVDGLLFTCEQELLLARQTFPNYLPKKEQVVGLGIQQPPAYREAMSKVLYESFPILQNKKYLVFLGRVDFKKGVDLLIQAYLEIVTENTQTDIPLLVVAGPGLDSPFGIALKQLVESKPQLKDKVIFTGMIGGDLKWGSFYHSECFILPSHQENFGIAVVEALACEIPVLISNQVNIWKEIHNSKGGIVDNDDLEGTKRMVQQFLALSNEERHQMKQHAKSCYHHHFTTNAAAKKLVETIGLAKN